MKVIPNSVGRLDPVTDAIRSGNRELVAVLLRKELDRLEAKASAIQKDLDRANEDSGHVAEFLDAIESNDGWNRARKECGWSGVDYTNFDEAKAKAYADAPKPKLDAATLPIGAVMVLGGKQVEDQNKGRRGLDA